MPPQLRLLIALTLGLVTALGACEGLDTFSELGLCVDVTLCDDGNPCTHGLCEPATGACTYVNIQAACDDGDACTIDDACDGGQCLGTPVNCPDVDGNPCTTEACSPLTFTCEATVHSDACDDGDPCTESDQCKEGTCAGEPILCEDDGDVCTDDLCVDGVCGVLNQALCDDGDPCTLGDVCADGACAGEALICEGDFACVDGVCIDPCVPECTNKDCGEDGCGAVCGTCAWGEVCNDGQCTPLCSPDCGGKECGPDGCGGSCGFCGETLICSGLGLCYDSGICEPICPVEAPCGPDGCGGQCGQCLNNKFCVDQQCSDVCVPQCEGKSCGDDGCGDVCGTCPEGLACTLGGLCGGPCSGCDASPECLGFSFEGGALSGWYLDGAAVVIQSLGDATPTDGEAMLFLLSGYNASTETGSWKLLDADPSNGIWTSQQQAEARLSHCLPVGTWSLSLDWRYYAEDFKEYCGSQFEDYFRVELVRGEEVEPLLSIDLPQLCGPNDGTCSYCEDTTPCSLECMGTEGCYAGSDTCEGTYPCQCGEYHQGLEPSDVHFDQGGAYRTPWVSQQVPLYIDDPAPFELRFVVGDSGDSIFDVGALIDNVHLEACTPDCVGKVCGFDGCGGQCGTCTESALCAVPTCEAGACTTAPAEQGSVCPSDSLCTMGQCDDAGNCKQIPVEQGSSCGSSTECTTGACDGAGVCQEVQIPAGEPCQNDGNLCTEDVCDGNGLCHHPPVTAGTPCASDGNPCTEDACDAEGLCQNTWLDHGQPCPDDANDCTDDICDGHGACIHPVTEAGTPCSSDQDNCTDDLCNGAGVCEHVPNGDECP